MPTFFQRLLGFFPHIYRPVANGVLYALLTAIAKMFDDFDQDFLVAVQQMNVLTSRGLLLTFWGYMFRVKRYGNSETDADYARRIVRTVFLPRTTESAILTALKGITPDAQVVEYGPGVTLDKDYRAFAADTQGRYPFVDWGGRLPADQGNFYTQHYERSFIIQINYKGDAVAGNSLFIGRSFLGVLNTGFISPAVSAPGVTDKMVREIVEDMKAAGVRVIYNKQ